MYQFYVPLLKLYQSSLDSTHLECDWVDQVLLTNYLEGVKTGGASS